MEHISEKDKPQNQPLFPKQDIAEQLTGEPVRKPRGKKDTKKWCRGKVGRGHKPEVRINPWYRFLIDSGRYTEHTICREYSWMADSWFCHHHVYCTECGKTLQDALPKGECPTYIRERG